VLLNCSVFNFLGDNPEYCEAQWRSGRTFEDEALLDSFPAVSLTYQDSGSNVRSIKCLKFIK
jgi:hypothetical protein